jgi:P27 family predicted phage terminase small subunit
LGGTILKTKAAHLNNQPFGPSRDLARACRRAHLICVHLPKPNGSRTVLRILTDLDRAALAAYCQAYGRWVEAERKLQETPLLLKMPSGYVQQNPRLTIANKQLELMHKYLSDFGLSPVSRSRVSVTPAFGPKPWEFGQSKFAGLLGGQKDGFFDD